MLQMQPAKMGDVIKCGYMVPDVYRVPPPPQKKKKTRNSRYSQFSRIYSCQQLSLFALVDRASLLIYNNTKVIKCGWDHQIWLRTFLFYE